VPKHLGASVGITAVLHTWGSAMTHHPHVHMIVPGGGISFDGQRWIACRPGFFLPVRVLSRLFRRLFLDKLAAAHAAARLNFFDHHAVLAGRHVGFPVATALNCGPHRVPHSRNPKAVKGLRDLFPSRIYRKSIRGLRPKYLIQA
jgi:hypothetical protein